MIEIKFQVTAEQLADPNIIHLIGRLQQSLQAPSGTTGPSALPKGKPQPSPDVKVEAKVPVEQSPVKTPAVQYEIFRIPSGPLSEVDLGRTGPQVVRTRRVAMVETKPVGPIQQPATSASAAAQSPVSKDASDVPREPRAALVGILKHALNHNKEILGESGTLIAEWMLNGINGEWEDETPKTTAPPREEPKVERPSGPEKEAAKIPDNPIVRDLISMLVEYRRIKTSETHHGPSPK